MQVTDTEEHKNPCTELGFCNNQVGKSVWFGRKYFSNSNVMFIYLIIVTVIFQKMGV